MGSGTNKAEFRSKVVSGRRISVVIRSLVNAKGLQFECAKVVPLLMYGSETMAWKKKERSSIMDVQMNNLIGLLGVKGMAKVLNARIRELCGMKKGVD